MPLTASNAYRVSDIPKRRFAGAQRAAAPMTAAYAPMTAAYAPMTAAYAPMLSHIAGEDCHDAVENLFGVSAQFVLAQPRDGVRREYDRIAGGAPHCRHGLGCFYEPVGAYGNRGYAGFLCVDSVVHTARAA